MKTVWKYVIPVVDRVAFTMPAGAEILTIQTQQGIATAWVLVDPTQPSETRVLLVRGTGQPCEGVGRYVGTFQIADGELVFHVFEQPEAA